MGEWIFYLLVLGLLVAAGIWLYQFFNARPALAHVLVPHRTNLACAAAGQSVWDWDRATDQFFLSSPLEEVLGYASGALNGDAAVWFSLLHADDRETCLNSFASYAQYKNSSFHMEFRLRHADGHFLWIELNASMVGTRLIGLANEITQRKRAEERLLLGTIYDPLTGLANRALLLDRIDRRMSDGGDIGLVVLDINKFRNFNESLGHVAGDHLLLAITERLTALLPKGGSLARVGADEFALLLPAAMPMPDWVAHLHQELSKPMQIIGQEIMPSFALGWTDSRSSDGAALMEAAGIAMQLSRQQSEPVHFQDSMRNSDPRPLLLEADLHHALSRNEMLLHYQPIIHLADTKAWGFEALMRWRHPKFGWVAPAEFIPLAEANGLIEQLGMFALSEAARALARWQLTYHYKPPLFVSVNISRRELFREGLAQNVKEIIARNFLAVGQLKLEITERLMIQHPDHVKQVLEQLRSVGAHIAIDDFGVGYSSLGWLQHLPFDIIKLDRTLIGAQSIENPDAKTDAIITAIVSMAHEMGVEVVAEGTDNSTKAVWLHKTGCDYAQGFYYARPMEEEKVLSFLPRNRPR